MGAGQARFYFERYIDQPVLPGLLDERQRTPGSVLNIRISRETMKRQ
jgi:hypothetical protein